MENDDSDEMMNEYMAYELKPFNVVCGICGFEQCGSEKALREQHWFLGSGMEICPKHN